MQRHDLTVVSGYARAQAEATAKYAREMYVRNGRIGVREVLAPPEETTTFNAVVALARRLAQQSSKASVLLHSKYLEGTGTARRGPSKADLQIAVEIQSNRWFDFAIQAKRFFPDPKTYDEWNSNDNLQLYNWTRKRPRLTIPALILYNTATDPFPTTHGRHTDLFQGCQCYSIRTLASNIGFWTGHRVANPGGWSPLAISMVLDIYTMLTLDKPCPADIADVAFPWECLLCPHNPHFSPPPGPTGPGGPGGNAGPAGVGGPGGNAGPPGPPPLTRYESGDMPDWASEVELLYAQPGEDLPAPALDAILADNEDFSPAAWLVLRTPGVERDRGVAELMMQ